MTLRKNLPLAALAAVVLTASCAMSDVFVTATERENKKLVKVDVTPPFTAASCMTRTGSPDCIATIFNTPDVPDSLVQDSLGRLIYSEPVANQIRRVNPDGTGDTLLADSTVGISFPQDMILDPTGNFLLVADFSGNKITKVNLAGPFPNGTVFTTISAPEGMVFDNTGRLFVNAGFGTASAGIYQLDPTTGAILKSNVGFDPANEPDGLTFDPSTNRLFATSSGIPGPPSPPGGSNSIYSIDPNTLGAVKIATVPAPDGVITDFHGTLYIASRAGFVYSVNETTFVTTQLTSVPTIDDLGIVPAQPPTATKTFSPPNVVPGGTATVTITVTNPNPAPIALNGINFTDTLPSGLVVAPVPNASNTCGGTLSAVAGANSVTLAPPPANSLAAGASCTVKFDVLDSNSTGTPPSQNCVTVNSSNAGSAGTACAMILSAGPVALNVTKGFGSPAPGVPSGTVIPFDGCTLMTIEVINTTATAASGVITFTDTLPAGLIVAAPNNLSNSCGGTATATAGSGTVSLTGGSLAAAPPTSRCDVSVNVCGILGGLQTNTVTVHANGFTPDSTATATLTVLSPPMPPQIAKSFSVSSLPVFGTATLTFLVTNPNTGPPPMTLGGVNFTDTLPVGLVVATPANVIGTCGGGTITAFDGTNVISLTGATLPGGGSCTFSVDVTAILAGPQINTTSNIASTNPILVGNTATATLNVNPPDDAYQINYLPNVKVAGAVDITNAGSLGADPFGPRSGTSGRICANVYVFDPVEEEISCCSCLVTPNALVHITAADLIGNTATGAQPDSVVVKLVFTVPGTSATAPGTQAGPFTASTCNAAFPFNLTNLAPGGRAWAEKFHSPTVPVSTFTPTETPFLFNPIRLGELTQNTIGELNMLTNLCQFIVGNQTGAGICRGCTIGGIGGAKQ